MLDWFAYPINRLHIWCCQPLSSTLYSLLCSLVNCKGSQSLSRSVSQLINQLISTSVSQLNSQSVSLRKKLVIFSIHKVHFLCSTRIAAFTSSKSFSHFETEVSPVYNFSAFIQKKYQLIKKKYFQQSTLEDSVSPTSAIFARHTDVVVPVLAELLVVQGRMLWAGNKSSSVCDLEISIT